MIGERIFTASDQLRFAAASGDFNPLHLDPVFARRTMFGQPIVHGIHLVLWALDRCAAVGHSLASASALSVKFPKPLFLDEAVVLTTAQDGARMVLDCVSDEATLCRIELTLSESRGCAPTACAVGAVAGEWSRVPADPAIETMATLRGAIEKRFDLDAVTDLFPAAAASLGPQRLASLLALTRIVGMECPGLNSLFGGLSLTFDAGDTGSSVNWKVAKFRSDISFVRIAVEGGGLAGTLDCFVRPRPLQPVAPARLAELAQPDAFAGERALVIGGSRGLGAAAARLLAAGGADIVLTYRVGRREADAIAAAITETGGRARTIELDVSAPDAAIARLAEAGWSPSQIYYFATPHIFVRKKHSFEEPLLQSYLKCYVVDFVNIALLCRARLAEKFALFYPSTIAINEPLRDLGEYVAAKSAGEGVCSWLPTTVGGVTVVMERLKRLQTDQTATLMDVPAGDPLDAMAEICRRMTAASRALISQ